MQKKKKKNDVAASERWRDPFQAALSPQEFPFRESVFCHSRAAVFLVCVLIPAQSANRNSRLVVLPSMIPAGEFLPPRLGLGGSLVSECRWKPVSTTAPLARRGRFSNWVHPHPPCDTFIPTSHRVRGMLNVLRTIRHVSSCSCSLNKACAPPAMRKMTEISILKRHFQAPLVSTAATPTPPRTSKRNFWTGSSARSPGPAIMARPSVKIRRSRQGLSNSHRDTLVEAYWLRFALTGRSPRRAASCASSRVRNLRDLRFQRLGLAERLKLLGRRAPALFKEQYSYSRVGWFLIR